MGQLRTLQCRDALLQIAANQMVRQKESDKTNNIKTLITGPLCDAYSASKFAVRGLTQVTGEK